MYTNVFSNKITKALQEFAPGALLYIDSLPIVKKVDDTTVSIARHIGAAGRHIDLLSTRCYGEIARETQTNECAAALRTLSILTKKYKHNNPTI